MLTRDDIAEPESLVDAAGMNTRGLWKHATLM